MRFPSLLLAAVLFTASLTFAAAPARTDDATYSRLILGQWNAVKTPGAITQLSGNFVFNANATFTSFAVLEFNGASIRIDVEGTWRIAAGKLIEKITKSSRPEIVPGGLETTDTILRLDDKVLETKDADGTVERMEKDTRRAVSV